MRPARARIDRRLAGVLLTAALVLTGGLALTTLAPLHEPMHEAEAPPAAGDELKHRFDAAVLLLHGRRFDEALAQWQRVLELAPGLPEAHVNIGFTLLGLRRPEAARAAFERAIALRPAQANAYYGLAMAQEALGDLALARGAMRSYLHLARDESEAHLARARAALWEWESAPAGRALASPPP